VGCSVPTALDEGAWAASLRPSDGDGAAPAPLRWDPLPCPPPQPCTWLEGMHCVARAGDPHVLQGVAVHCYAADAAMHRQAFYNGDGDLLLVPETGALVLQTELGVLEVEAGEIAVLPRGVRFAVLCGAPIRGYVLEVYGGHFELPELGPIGANGLANAQDFAYPAARYEDVREPFEIVAKVGGRLWRTRQDHSPFDVVAWRGNYAPFKYDLARFVAVNTVTVDHMVRRAPLTSRTRPSSPSSRVGATRPAPPTRTWSSFRRAGPWRNTPSARPTSTATA
jgi:homogentisate 1,2-dioxygenase